MNIVLTEHELGRALERSLRHCVPTLNEVTSSMLEDLRKLSPPAVHTYLRWHLREGSEAFFEDFTSDVIRGEVAPARWGSCDVLVLVGEDRAGAALAMSAEQVREMLAGVEGERWARLSVDDARLVNRNAAGPGFGAPGVLVRGAPYWWTSSNKDVRDYIVASTAMRNVVPMKLDLVSGDGFVIAFRRWIARRAAWWVEGLDIDLSTTSPLQLVAAIGIEMDKVTPDGAAAVSALLREAKLPFDAERHVRGFVGPDEWYAAG